MILKILGPLRWYVRRYLEYRHVGSSHTLTIQMFPLYPMRQVYIFHRLRELIQYSFPTDL